MSSSTQTPFLKSVKEKLSAESSESDFLLIEDTPDYPKLAANGINFLWKAFPYALHTFQYIKASTTEPTRNVVKCYKNKNSAYKEAYAYNQKGYDVYFMVNEGDGRVIPPHRTSRSQDNISFISKCFIDTDNCPIEKVREYLDSVGITPHAEIESSPGRYHLYFDVIPASATPQNILQWKAVQNMLHRLGDETIKNPSKSLGMDKTMHDFSKLLRVPGFTHVKKLYTVRLVCHNEDLPLFSLDNLFTATGGQRYIDYNVTNYGKAEPSNVPDLDVPGASPIEPGDRYSSLQSLALHLANQTGTPASEHLSTFKSFVTNRLDNSDHVYLTKSGELTAKSKALFDSAFAKVATEIRHQPNSQQNLTASLLKSEDSTTISPWFLPDDFYTSAPNGFGDVVKQVLSNSLYPCAALSFGTFLTGLSLLKCKTHLTPHGSAPSLYTLNVAISGYGKGDPMTMLQNTFWHYGHGKLLANKIRSDRGVYEHLSSNNGYGLFLLDEVAPLLKTIQQKDASSHHAYIAEALLQLYSSGAMKGVSFGKVGKSTAKSGEKEIVIDNPMLAVCGFTVPYEFESLFSSDSVVKGLFQRFIPIVADITRVPKNELADKHAIIKSDLFASIPGATELDNDGNPVEALSNSPIVKMTYSPQALKEFRRIEDYYRDKLISSAKDPETAMYSGLYSRLAEQIERVATVLSTGEIDLPTLLYAVRFIESRHTATMAIADRTVLKGRGSVGIENETVVVDTLTKICKEENAVVVYKSDVYARCRRQFSSMKEFDQAINECVELRRITLVPGFKKNIKNARPGMGMKLGEIFDTK